ncbi:MAG: hypothetical protein P4L50_08295, partial [Anaerolineaceae bacterium]|nr:hypothetical protein [Anaerolineaceae bacterium]
MMVSFLSPYPFCSKSYPASVSIQVANLIFCSSLSASALYSHALSLILRQPALKGVLGFWG